MNSHGVAIGGQAVNAFVEPLVSLDLDLVVAARLVEAYPKLREGVPAGILDRLFVP